MLSIETQGLGAAMDMLRSLEKLGSRARGAVLNAKERVDSGISNAQIIKWLIEGGRDFFSPDDEMIKAVETVMVQAMEKEIEKQKNQRSRNDKSRKMSANKSAEAEAQKIATMGLMAGMDAAKEIMVNRIESQTTADGGSPDELSLEYANWKDKNFGFTTIGKLTGQLLDNLAPGKRNIKITK